MPLAQPVSRTDHEANDLARSIDDAEPVGGLGIIDLVEILIESFEEALLL